MKVERFCKIKSKPYRNFYDLTDVDKLGIHAIAFLEAAETLEVIENRFSNWWIPAYYSLYHALELTVKVAIGARESNIPCGHKVSEIINSHTSILNLSDAEIVSVSTLEDLNSGKGQLRYPNEPKGEFYPDVFNTCGELTIRLLQNLEKVVMD